MSANLGSGAGGSECNRRNVSLLTGKELPCHTIKKNGSAGVGEKKKRMLKHNKPNKMKKKLKTK